MKLISNVFFGLMLFASIQSLGQERPKVQDLDFFIGKWDLTFKFYRPHEPGSASYFSEKGWQICEYDMDLNGTPMYIVCKGELEVDSGKFMGRKRSIQAFIRYSRFENSFERIGFYSNWPATGLEVLEYDSSKAQFVIRGQLNVQNNMLERYVDVYQFNEDYTSFERTNVANFSDMPYTEYNLTFNGTGRKVDD